MKNYIKSLITPLLVTLSMFIICGLIYPISVTLIAQVIMPKQANGSLIMDDNEIIGSALIGQDFDDPKLFHCRPSAINYNTYTKQALQEGSYSGVASGSYNYAMSNPNLHQRIQADIETILQENPTISTKDIPADLISASGSGLDPHISVQSAYLQMDRISQNTGIAKDTLTQLIQDNTSPKLLNIFGEECVNVLKLNLDLLATLATKNDGQ